MNEVNCQFCQENSKTKQGITYGKPERLNSMTGFAKRRKEKRPEQLFITYGENIQDLNQDYSSEMNQKKSLILR